MNIQAVAVTVGLLTALVGGTLKVDTYFAHENDFVSFKLEYRLQRINATLRKLRQELREYKRIERKRVLTDDEIDEKNELEDEIKELQEEKAGLNGRG